MPKISLPPKNWIPPSDDEARERRKRVFRWLRVSRGWSQGEAADHYGIDRRNWVYYERQGRNPNPELVARIVHDTELPAAWIVGEIGEVEDGDGCSDA